MVDFGLETKYIGPCDLGDRGHRPGPVPVFATGVLGSSARNSL